MVNIVIRAATGAEEVPLELLLLADPSKSLVEAYLNEGRCFVAVAGTEIVGEFVLLETAPGTVEIVNLAVKPEFQGRGIGKRLTLQAIEEANRLGAAQVEIATGNSSLRQLKLYQQCGFRIVGVDRDFFVRQYDEAIIEDGIPCRDMIRLRLTRADAR